MRILITFRSTPSITFVSEVAVVFRNAFVLHGVGPPILSSEGAILHASAHLHDII